MSQFASPNVLLITADDQRFDTISALGKEHVRTPNLDSLVGSGCTYTHHHNMGADQMAVCVPARSMIHSGTSLFHLKGPGGMTDSHPTLPERFGEAEYRTFGTGKWHNGVEAFNRSFANGEDIFFGGMGNHWNVPISTRHPDGGYSHPRPHRFDSGTGRVETIEQIYDRYAPGTHSSELFADATIDFIRSHHESGASRPFFAYMATMAPHDPRTPPGEYLRQYDPADLPLPENFRPAHPFDNGRLNVRDELLERPPRDPENLRRHIADYYAMITHLDAQIGRVLDTLDELGERENTIVVFTADHGLALGRHGLMGKQNLYDHSVRVPLIFAGPGVPENERRDDLSCHYDLYPTLCDLAGIEIPDSIEGEPLISATDQAQDVSRESLLLAYENIQRAVREDRFKLIEYYVDGERHTQLFDIENDPDESMNLADDEEYRDELNRLRDRLGELRMRFDDPTVQT